MVDGASALGDWTARDRALLEAYQIIEDETCPECQNPIWLCTSGDPNIGFKVHKHVCQGKYALDAETTDLTDMKKEERRKALSNFGVIRYTKPYTIDDTKLPLRRDVLTKE